jgi:hypothetical protein
MKREDEKRQRESELNQCWPGWSWGRSIGACEHEEGGTQVPRYLAARGRCKTRLLLAHSHTCGGRYAVRKEPTCALHAKLQVLTARKVRVSGADLWQEPPGPLFVHSGLQQRRASTSVENSAQELGRSWVLAGGAARHQPRTEGVTRGERWPTEYSLRPCRPSHMCQNSKSKWSMHTTYYVHPLCIVCASFVHRHMYSLLFLVNIEYHFNDVQHTFFTESFPQTSNNRRRRKRKTTKTTRKKQAAIYNNTRRAEEQRDLPFW